MIKPYSCKKQNYWANDEPYHLDIESLTSDFVCSIYSADCDSFRNAMFEKGCFDQPFLDMNKELYSQIDKLINPKSIDSKIE